MIDYEGTKAILGIVTDITERKKVEKALKTERDKLQALMDGIDRAGIGIDIVGVDYRVSFQSKTLKEKFGEFHGKSCYEHYKMIEEPCDQCPAKQSMRVKKAVCIEHTGCDGRDYQVYAAPLPDADGTVSKAIEIVLDITERKRAEQSLLESEKRLKILFESAPDAYYIHDLEGRFIDGNRAAEELVGYRKEDAIGKSIFELGLVIEEDVPKSMAAIAENRAGKPAGPLELTLNHKDSHQIIVETRSYPVELGGEMLILGIARDITERKRAEEELKKSEKRYRLLVEFASDSIFLLDINGGFLDVNPAACDSLGRTREELLTLSMSDIDLVWTSKKIKSFLRELDVGRPVTIEGIHCRKNKTSFPVEIRLTKIDVDNRQVVLSLARDITQRRRIEESLRRKAEAVSHEDKVHVSGIDIEWDHDKGVCTFEQLPVALMWIDTTLAGVMSGVQAMVGTECFGLALQSEGRKSVEDDWRVISQFPDFKRGFEAIANIAAVAGWGDWKLIEIDTENKECLFRMWNSWEGLYQKALGVSWGSGMLAGKLAGYCSMLFKTNCWADQTTYIAKGDAFDEFKVHPSNRSVEKEIENLLVTDKATRADMAVALQKLRIEIAARKDMEQALRESEQHYRAIVEDQTELICRYLPDGTMTFVNEAYCRYFSKSRDELIGHKFMPFIPEADHEKVNKHLTSLGHDHPVATHEHRVTMPSGEIRWHQWTSRAILDDEGKVVEFQGTWRDVTERKQAEDEIRTHLSFLDSVMEQSPFAMWISDTKGTVIRTNNVLRNILNLTDAQILGKYNVLEDGNLEEQDVLKQVRAVFEKNKSARFIIPWIGPKVGDVDFTGAPDLWIDISIFPIVDAEGNLTNVVCQWIDITERKLAEKRLQQYQVKLKSLTSELTLAEERERRRIAAGIHDDLAQKLALAKFELQSLGASVEDGNIRRSLEDPCNLIDEIVQDARELVFDLGNAALYQVGLEAAVESWLEHEIREKHGLKCELVRDTSGLKLDDDTQIILFRAVKELVANVVKYANASTVTVCIRKSGDTVRVSVEDDGTGFDVSKLDTTFTTKGGFGLFNIRERLDFLGGNLKINTGPGKGTCVIMKVPVGHGITTG